MSGPLAPAKEDARGIGAREFWQTEAEWWKKSTAKRAAGGLSWHQHCAIVIIIIIMVQAPLPLWVPAGGKNPGFSARSMSSAFIHPPALVSPGSCNCVCVRVSTWATC